MTRVALVMAGGTGGHVFPALATARVLQQRGYDIVWLGTQRGIEARLVRPAQHANSWRTFVVEPLPVVPSPKWIA